MRLQQEVLGVLRTALRDEPFKKGRQVVPWRVRSRSGPQDSRRWAASKVQSRRPRASHIRFSFPPFSALNLASSTFQSAAACRFNDLARCTLGIEEQKESAPSDAECAAVSLRPVWDEESSRPSIQRRRGSSVFDPEYCRLKGRQSKTPQGHSGQQVALVTPCLPHLPFHPACLLGYGAAVLARPYDVDIIDLNAELHFRELGKLKVILHAMDETSVLSDALFLHPFYAEAEGRVDGLYEAVPWEKYSRVYVTSPSWFPTVPTEAVLRLTRAVRRVSSETAMFFFGNSLGSWTDEGELKKNGVQPVHLNDVFATDASPNPVLYDLLPTPMYEHLDKYLFDLLPFMLKHGCDWGRCRFCSFCAGWNAGHLERSPRKAIEELEILIELYNPRALVCRDHSLNGHNLIDFCGYFERLRKDWCGQSRADLTEKQIHALRKAGCRLIYFGLESGSDRTLRSINKGITSKQMSDFTKGLHANGILPSPSVIVGAPGEERPDFEKTIEFLEDHRRYLEVVNIYPFMPTPASDFNSREAQPHPDATMRLFELMATCEDIGLKVCLGEQSIEYFLFNRLYDTC